MRILFLLISVFIIANVKAQSGFKDSFYKSFDGTNIHYFEKGEGKPVVLLHGFIVGGSSWLKTEVVSELVKSGYKVIIPDLRGNGSSDKPHDIKAYENDAEIKDVMFLLNKLNIKTYDLVGYSRGAILAARLLIIDKNISKAVLGGIGANFTNPDWPRRKMFEEAFSGKAHLYPQTKGAIDYAKSINADTIVMGYLQHVQPSTSVQQLSKVKKPVLVISGSEDTDNGNASDLSKLIPGSILKTVPGNHNNTAQSLEFGKAVLEFLQKK